MRLHPPDDDRRSLDDRDAASFREDVQRLYAGLDQAIRREGPVCELSGRCCRFEEYGHTLFVSEPEFAILVSDAPDPVRPVDQGETCPWQDHRGHCTAREARPLGCRVYYCDPGYQEVGQTIAEHAITQLKDLVNRLGLPWGYAPLHHHLHRAVATGRLAEPAVRGLVRRDEIA